MLTIKKENVVYDIDEALWERYHSKGYEIVDYSDAQNGELTVIEDEIPKPEPPKRKNKEPGEGALTNEQTSTTEDKAANEQ